MPGSETEYDKLKREKYPKEKKRVIYSTFARGQPHAIGGMAVFTPIFDSTDHLQFACSKCAEVATVILVRRDDTYANEPTVYFHLRCAKCSAMGQRKIYLEDQRGKFMQIPTAVRPVDIQKQKRIMQDEMK